MAHPLVSQSSTVRTAGEELALVRGGAEVLAAVGRVDEDDPLATQSLHLGQGGDPTQLTLPTLPVRAMTPEADGWVRFGPPSR